MHWLWYSVFVLFFNIVYARLSPERNCNNTQFQCNDGQCISKDLWCVHQTRYVKCRDRSNLRNCGRQYPNCPRNQSFCVENNRCIPLAWACDGYEDCPNGSDETECLVEGYRIKDIPGVTISREKAKSWLLQKRRDWGWKKDTARAIVALYLSNVKEFAPDNLSGTLTVKELRLQTVELVMRNNSNPLSTYQLALFINALLATCQNPRNFFNFNLVDGLHQRAKTKSASINPFVALTLCNANETISEDYVVQLLELYFRRTKPERVDSIALASMALTCLRNRNESLIMNSISTMGKSSLDANTTFPHSICNGLQLEDGSFGSVYTTALMLQVILGDLHERISCNFSDAISFLISKQKPNGAFNDIMSTYLVLPILYGKTLIDLGNVKCSNLSPNLTVQEEFEAKDTRKQKVGYSIQVGIKEVMFTMYMKVPVNVTFFDVMRLAAELDPRYSFEYVSYPWGKFTYSIFGIVNDPEARKYWQLYRITKDEEMFLEQTPDEIITKDNESYMYWYKPTD